MSWRKLLTVAIISSALPMPATPVLADETISYTYDVFGRLVTVTSSGTVNNGVQTTYQHDAADNRVRVIVTGSITPPPGGSVDPPPPPSPPSPPPSPSQITVNNPQRIVAGNTATTFAITDLATLNGRSGVIASFTPSGGSGGIAGDGQSASFTAPAALKGGSNCDPGDDQTITISYSIQDSANSATVSGTATVTVPGRPAVGGGACQ